MKQIKTAEFAQAAIRLCIGALTYFYISAGIESGYFSTSQTLLVNISIVFFGISMLIIISIFWKPVSTSRRYMALAFDVASATMSSYLTGGINSVYVLVYLWIYIGYGTRYGLRFLSTAVIFTLIGYNVLLLNEDAWHLLTLEAVAFLFLIIALPAYLYSLQKRLIQSANKAISASDAKSEFLSNMTHQIRTPIGGIVGMIDLLNKTSLNNQQKQYLQALSQSSNSLQEIIEDIIDFSRIESGALSLNQSTTNSRALIDSLVHSLAPLGYEKELELTCLIDRNFPTDIHIDAQRFRQLLSNLIRYAIEHSTRKGIHIHAYSGNSKSSNMLSSCIDISFQQNTEITHLQSNQIPETNEALPLRIGYQLTRLMNGLFEIQYNDRQEIHFNLHFNWNKPENENTLNTEMTQGKRVLIYDADDANKNVLEQYCKQLDMETYVTSGDGNLIAHIIWSQEKDKPFDVIILGEDRERRSCHELVLRIHSEAKCNVPILYATYLHSIDHIETDSMQGVHATIIKPVSLDILRSNITALLTQHTPDSPKALQEVSGMNILLAEDNEINASVVYSLLTELGHNVDIATDGTTALYAMHKHMYHLVLMDINMPNMDGIETTRQWRRLEKGRRHLPIVALTAKATSNDRDRCMEAGMDDFLTKPVNESQLKNVLNRYVNQPIS